MNILLLGSSGFIGRNLFEYLSENRKDLKIDAPSSKELNILDEDSVASYLSNQRYDLVINAAICVPNKSNYDSGQSELEQDLRMFYNLERCAHLFGKMYYFGSGAEYDKSDDIISVKEERYVNGIPKNQYGIAKYTIGKLIRNSKNIYNFRIFGLFGKYENWKTTFISGACCKAVKDLPITIRKNVVFDYLYINDFVRIIEWFIDNEPLYHEYNLCSGTKHSLIELANIVKKVSQKNIPIIVCKSGLAKEYTASNDRLLEEIKNFKFTDISEAIEDLYHYYYENRNSLDLLSLLYQ